MIAAIRNAAAGAGIIRDQAQLQLRLPRGGLPNGSVGGNNCSGMRAGCRQVDCRSFALVLSARQPRGVFSGRQRSANITRFSAGGSGNPASAGGVARSTAITPSGVFATTEFGAGGCAPAHHPTSAHAARSRPAENVLQPCATPKRPEQTNCAVTCKGASAYCRCYVTARRRVALPGDLDADRDSAKQMREWAEAKLSISSAAAAHRHGDESLRIAPHRKFP